MIFIRFSFAILLFLSGSSYAITNMEFLNNQGREQGLHGNIEVSLSGKSGNSNKQTNSFSGQLSFKKHKHQLLTSASAEFGESNGVKDTDNYFVHQRYIHHSSNKIAHEGFVQFQNDAFKLLDSRALVGGGIRFKLSDPHNSNDLLLNVGLGAYYTKEVFNAEDGSHPSEKYARANSYINFAKPLSDNTTISNTLYWQPRLSNFSDVYLYNNFALTVKINKALALKVTVETNYDSDPFGDLETTDHNYFTSLSYSF